MKAAVAMSGGVDSSVAALLLKQKGYDVAGITGLMFNSPSSQQVIDNARNICDILEIPHYVADLRKIFTEKVTEYFIRAYKNGLTPNPCAVCNKYIKWGEISKYAFEKLGADFYATGHYAKNLNDKGAFKLLKPKDEKKDQRYMLFELSQRNLSKTLFPMADFLKNEIKQIAANNNLPCAVQKESQDVCFISWQGKTRDYLISKLGKKSGNIVHFSSGEILGKHEGVYLYTIGQRKGICISDTEALYVVKSDISTNTLYVGYKDDLECSELVASHVNFQQSGYEGREFEAFVKIRYNSPKQKAIIAPQDDNRIKIIFENPQYAVTCGQAAVIYDIEEDFLIGGGWIEDRI
jgi:tRNA-uridine 2-sulfurtransferase